MRLMGFPLLAAAGACAVAATDTAVPSGSDRFGAVLSETRAKVCPGVVHVHRTTSDPLNIHVLLVDTRQPGVELRVCLAGDTATGVETVRSMAVRKGAVAAVNGDYWTHGGIPLGLTILDGEIVIAPKFRTAFGVRRDGTAVVGRWSGGWTWQAEIEAADGARHAVTMMNSDCNPGWLCLYTSRYGMSSMGRAVAPVTEVVCNLEHRVLEVRRDLPGVPIPSGGFVLTGRDAAGAWLAEHCRAGDLLRLDLRSSPPWQELREAIGAGPRILRDGVFVQDPIAPMPEGEEFTLDWKRAHYLRRHPRTGLGVTRDGRGVVLVTVDGRQPAFSVGVFQEQLARILLEFGAWDGMDLDSGGSTTMVIRGEVVNRPSDNAAPDGSGGEERKVANALLVHYHPADEPSPRTGDVPDARPPD